MYVGVVLSCVVAWVFLIVMLVRYKKLQERAGRLGAELERDRREFRDTLCLQLGMTFKFEKRGGQFIHTLCVGKLSQQLGQAGGDIVGLSLSDFISDPEYVAYKEFFYNRAWNGEEVSYEGAMNGIWYLASLRPIFKEGKVREVIASCVDITEQKRMEHDLRESEQMYRLIAETTTDLICILEPDMTIRYASPSHQTVLGYLPAELQGCFCSQLVAPEERERVAEEFYAMIERKCDYQANFHGVRKDGTTLMLETHGKPFHDENGDVTSIVVISRDLTTRMKEEEESRKNDKLALAGQLAAGIAHEIRNPLTAIKGFVHLLKTAPDSRALYTDIISSELDRVESIVNEFLLLAKPPRATQFCQQDLSVLVKDVVTLLNSQAILQNVEIHVGDFPGSPYVMAADSQLKQVFVNIIKNAIESMPDGGNVFVSGHLDEESILVRVQDEGQGIPKDRIPRLGEPFYTTKDRGTGLGLMVSYKIMKDHSGEIFIDTLQGRGTCIDVVLPLAQNLLVC